MDYLKIILYIVFLISVFSFLSLAPWVPTLKRDLDRVDKILNLKKGENFLEMGCGTAGVSIYLAKNNTDSNITAIELSPFFYIISKIRVYISGLENIEIIYGNALKLDLSKYDVIYVFGLPETVTNKIFPILSKEVDDNFRFISYCFQMKNDFFEEKKHKQKDRYSIYEYKKKTS